MQLDNENGTRIADDEEELEQDDDGGSGKSTLFHEEVNISSQLCRLHFLLSKHRVT